MTLIEAEARLLPSEEPEASAVIEHVLRRDNIDVRVNTQLARVEAAPGQATLLLSDGTGVDVDAVLVAIGRVAAVEGLGLDNAGIAVADGTIVTNDRLATSARGVWAVGGSAILFWNGTSWTTVSGADPSSSSVLYGVSTRPGAAPTWAVGANFVSGSGFTPFVLENG